jgi:peptidoglycan-N-acetylglucosamine deacetylase
MFTRYFKRQSRRPFRLAIFLASTLNLSALLLAFQPLPVKFLYHKPQPLAAARPELETALVSQIKTVDTHLTQVQESVALDVSSAIPEQFQGQIVSRVELQSGEKIIALTFDDGPWSHTPQILDILKKYDIKATFFIIGQHIQAHREELQRVVQEGHAIGNHTWNHRYQNVSAETAAAELGQTADLLKEVTETETSMFRPPGGNITNGLANYATQHNNAVIMWSVDSNDYRSATSVASMTEKVVGGIHSGAIVLLHDGGGNRTKTVQALPQIISQLQQQGYRFVTVPELLELKARESKPNVNPEPG